jgi:ankyrin repeat protein
LGSDLAAVLQSAAARFPHFDADLAAVLDEQQCGVVSSLLAAGADAYACDSHGCSALMYAAGSGNVQLVEQLVKLGLQLGQQDLNGWAPMHWAAAAGHSQATAALVAAQAPLMVADKTGRTALHW